MKLLGTSAGLLLVLAAALSLAACTPDRPALSFAPDRFPEGQVGRPLTVTVTVSGNVTPVGDIFVSDGTLPPGLSLHAQRGNASAEVAGTPRQAGTFTFTISAWCLGTNVSGQSGERKYEMVVK